MVRDLNGQLQPPRVVLVRGLAREAGHWHGFDRVLIERLAPVKVEHHDLAGNGAQWWRRSSSSIERLAADLRERVWAAGQQPPIVIAVSLGAMASLAWSMRWSGDPIRGLVVINTSVGGLCKPWQRMRIAGLLRTLGALVEADPVARELAILSLTSARFGNDLALAREQALIHERRPVARRNVLRQMLAGARFRAHAPLPRPLPLLVLNGADDRLVDPICSRRIAASFAGRLEVHPRAGHDLTLDDPQWCAEKIADWMARIESVTRP